MNKYELYLGDCLEIMDKLISEGVKADMVLCDPPFGTTHCKWDNIIPFDEMWLRLNKITNDNSPILLFGRQPFTSFLNISNVRDFRYELIWQKEQATNFMFLKKQFGQCTENISVFYKKQPTYNPQMIYAPHKNVGTNDSKTYKNQTFTPTKKWSDTKYPLNILQFTRDNRRKSYHPTQKPVSLLEYLIKTYTNEGDLVLDFTMGSGGTGVACINTDRRFIGIELDENYFNIAEQRIKEADNE